MALGAGNVSNRNRAQEALNSLAGWDSVQTISAIEIEHRRRPRLTAWMGFDAGNVSNQNRAQEVLTTHSLDGIRCRQCQQSKSSTGGAQLTRWIGFNAGNVSNQNRAQEALTTHSLDGI